MGISLHRGPDGDLDGVHLLGLLRERKSISGFFLGIGGIKILRLGAIRNFRKGQGSPELISNYGVQMTCL